MEVLFNIALTKDFKRDLKKLGEKKFFSPEVIEVLYLLQRGMSLHAKYKDHALIGEMAGYRDCHIFNDLVLIYKIENNLLYLVRINTHSEIFG